MNTPTLNNDALPITGAINDILIKYTSALSEMMRLKTENNRLRKVVSFSEATATDDGQSVSGSGDRIVGLSWSPPAPPCAECSYDHTRAETPFGPFLLTWKGWNDHDSPGFDETPWGSAEYHGWINVAAAQEWAAEEMDRRIKECLANAPITDHSPVEGLGASDCSQDYFSVAQIKKYAESFLIRANCGDDALDGGDVKNKQLWVMLGNINYPTGKGGIADFSANTKSSNHPPRKTAKMKTDIEKPDHATNPNTQPVSGSGDRIIRCFCYPAPPSQSNRGSDVIAVAIDERGATLSAHYCSNDSFAEHDIQNMGHGKKYDDRYPDGWSTVWLGREMPADWDGNPQYLNTKKEENL